MTSYQLQFEARKQPIWKIESLDQVPLSKNQISPPPLIDTPSLALIRKQLSDKFSEAACSHLNNLKKKRASSSEKTLTDSCKFTSYQFCPRQEISLQKQNSSEPIDPIDLDCKNLGLNDFESVYNVIIDFSNKDSHTKYEFSRLNIRSIDLSGNDLVLFFNENQIKNVQQRFKKFQKLKSVLSLNLQNQKQNGEKNQDFKEVFQEINFVMPNLEELNIDIPFEQQQILDLLPKLKIINNIQLERSTNQKIDKENNAISESSSQQVTKIRECRKNRKERAKSREFLAKQKQKLSPNRRSQIMSILDQNLSFQTNQTFLKSEMSHCGISIQQNDSQQTYQASLNKTETTQIQELQNQNVNKEDNDKILQIQFSQVTCEAMSDLSQQIFPQTEVPCQFMKPEIIENNVSLQASEEIEQLIMATEIKSSPLIIDEEENKNIKEKDVTLSDIVEEESENRGTFQSRNVSFKMNQKSTSYVQESTFSNESHKVFVGEIIMTVTSSPGSLAKKIGQGIKNRAEEVISRQKSSIRSKLSKSRSSKSIQAQQIYKKSDTSSNQSTPPQNNQKMNFYDEIETVTKIDKILLVNTAASQKASDVLSQTNIITRPFNLSNKENNSSNICELLLKNVKQKPIEPQVFITIPEKDLFTMRGILERIRILQVKCAFSSDSKKQLISKNSSKKNKDGNFEKQIDDMIKQLIYNASQPLSTNQYRQKDLEGQMYKIFEWINDQAISLLKFQKVSLGQKDALELSIILQKIQEEKDRIFIRMNQLFENKDDIELKRQALNELKRMNQRCEELESQYDNYVQLVDAFKQSQQEKQQQQLMIKDLEMQIQDQEDFIQKQNSKIKQKDTIIAEKDHQLGIIENRFIERLKTKDNELLRNKTRANRQQQEIQRLKENEIKSQISQLDHKTLEKRILSLELSKKIQSEELQNLKKYVKSKESDILKLTQLITILKTEANEMREEGEILYDDYQRNLNFIGNHLTFIQQQSVVGNFSQFQQNDFAAKRHGSLNSDVQRIFIQGKEISIKKSRGKSQIQIENEIKWIKKQIHDRSVTTRRQKLFDGNHNYNSLIKSFELDQKSVCSPTSFKSDSLSMTKKSNSIIGKPKSSSIINRRQKIQTQTQILSPALGSEKGNLKFRKSDLIQHYQNLIKNPDLTQIETTSRLSRKSELVSQPREKIISSRNNYHQIKTIQNSSKYSTIINSRNNSVHGLNQRMKYCLMSDFSQNQESGYSKIMSDRKQKMGYYYKKTSQQNSTCKRCHQRAEDSQHQQSENINFQGTHVCSSPNKRNQNKASDNFEISNNQDEIFKNAISKIDVRNGQASRYDSINPSNFSKNQIHLQLYTQNSERATETAMRDPESCELKNHVADTAHKRLTRISSQQIQETATKCEILPVNEGWKSYKSCDKSRYSKKDSLGAQTQEQRKQTKKSGSRMAQQKVQIQKPIILGNSNNMSLSRSSRRQRDQRNNPFRNSKNSTLFEQTSLGVTQLISPLQRPDYHQFFRENSSVVFGYPCTDNDQENATQYPGCGPISCPESRIDISKSVFHPSFPVSPNENQNEIPIIKPELNIKIDKNTKLQPKKQVKSKQTSQERQKSKLKTMLVSTTSPAKKKLRFITKKEPKSIKKKNVRSKSSIPMVKPLLNELSAKKQTRWDSVTAPTKSSKMKFQGYIEKKVN